MLYALNRNHPEPKVAYYMQRAANRFYLTAGSVIVIGKFIPESSETMKYYFLLWLVAVFIVILPSIKDLFAIKHDSWQDIETSAT